MRLQLLAGPIVKLGYLDEHISETLVTSVTQDTVARAEVDANGIGEVFGSHRNGGFDPQDFSSSLTIKLLSMLRFKLATHIENAYVSDSAALHLGAHVIAAVRQRKLRLIRLPLWIQSGQFQLW